MSLCDGNQQSAMVDNVIPFRKKGVKPFQDRLPMPTEAFLVETDKIYFLAVLYRDKNRRYHGNGYVTFEDGSKCCFTMGADGDPDMRERCMAVGQRIAKVYGGTLQQGRIGSHGRFCRGEEQNADSDS